MTDWSKPDLDILTTNSSKQGWCNVDPEDAYAMKVKIKEECDCKYDCLWGRFCETPVQCTCVNQCSRHGKCRGGFCQVIIYCNHSRKLCIFLDINLPNFVCVLSV